MGAGYKLDFCFIYTPAIVKAPPRLTTLPPRRLTRLTTFTPRLQTKSYVNITSIASLLVLCYIYHKTGGDFNEDYHS